MINIIISEPFTNLVRSQKLEEAALAALHHLEVPPDSDMSIVIEDDARLRDLNHDFLGIDEPTDVLSFPSGEESPDPETGRPYLGDIIISYPRASEQAETAGHAVQAELQLLVVHGVLHLLGHDHAEPGEKERMWSAQNAILARLDVHLTRLPE